MEIEAKLKYSNKLAIIKWLKNNGFKISRKIILEDCYFGQGHKSMSNANKLYRIRKIDNGTLELTLKTEAEGNEITQRKEINLKINNLSAASKILKSLECKLIKINRAQKEIWEKNEVSVEFIKNIRPQKINFIEIEGKNEKVIRNIIKSLDRYTTPVDEKIFSKK